MVDFFHVLVAHFCCVEADSADVVEKKQQPGSWFNEKFTQNDSESDEKLLVFLHKKAQNLRFFIKVLICKILTWNQK